jgi:hypothetical protein
MTPEYHHVPQLKKEFGCDNHDWFKLLNVRRPRTRNMTRNQHNEMTKYIMSVIKIKIKKQLFGSIRVQPWWYALGCGFAKLSASRTIAFLLKH